MIATTSGKHADFVKSLGADEVIDYTKEDFSKRVKGLDIVFDTIGGETQLHLDTLRTLERFDSAAFK